MVIIQFLGISWKPDPNRGLEIQRKTKTKYYSIRYVRYQHKWQTYENLILKILDFKTHTFSKTTNADKINLLSSQIIVSVLLTFAQRDFDCRLRFSLPLLFLHDQMFGCLIGKDSIGQWDAIDSNVNGHSFHLRVDVSFRRWRNPSPLLLS